MKLNTFGSIVWGSGRWGEIVPGLGLSQDNNILPKWVTLWFWDLAIDMLMAYNLSRIVGIMKRENWAGAGGWSLCDKNIFLLVLRLYRFKFTRRNILNFTIGTIRSRDFFSLSWKPLKKFSVACLSGRLHHFCLPRKPARRINSTVWKSFSPG